MESVERGWIAVRCCCQPTKVLGFLPATEAQRRAREWVCAPKVLYTPNCETDGLPTALLRFSEPTVLEIRNMGSQRGETYFYEPAIYSEDRPIEFWRTVPGFVEAAP